ncbi:MAG: hypothetical protein AMXMBFR53_38610 [Gemmatimonadota bacterium]
MTTRIKAISALVIAAVSTVALSGCDNLLDVDNPNSLTEESVDLPAAASGVANGSLRMLADAVSEVWQSTGVSTDEFFWTGSRDGWNTLDRGAIDEPRNEFLDAIFPELGTATWMGRKAIVTLEQHVADNPSDNRFKVELARAYFFNGMALLVTGETQEDMTFSDKMTDGAPVGPANMYQVLDDAIKNLDEAVTRFQALGNTNMVTAARAVRARAHMSRAIWNKINPAAQPGGALQWPAAAADAQAVLAAVGSSDYRYELGFTATASLCAMCDWINNRGENQVNDDLIALTTSGTGAAGRRTDPAAVAAALANPSYNGGPVRVAPGSQVNVIKKDPFTGQLDPTIKVMVDRFPTSQYGPLVMSSARLMHLILAEHALATGGPGDPGFVMHINHLRTMDGEAPFVSGGAVSDLAMLQYERRINTLFMGLRLPDMFRWGIKDPRWQAVNAAITKPGELFPITIVEQRANCHLNGLPCGG